MAGGINLVKDAMIGKTDDLFNVYALKPNPAEEITLNENLFQIALDKALDGLNRVSQQEIKSDALINQYVDGKVSLEEVIIQMEKATVSLSLAMTVINSAVQTTKEILQMAV